ncbi:hypothetical protein [Neobacillus citreus]|uniref:Uncharacterized protein n=1 Tax=Neobacillus citreus TaxID=2833578 RepID=A0A942YE95_9BACI|nr:hypothetical protein [Neobacillus citreus]MCH6268855.1 hypothetical protein [Neobacillus citreus]
MSDGEQNKNEAKEVNQYLSQKFKDYSARYSQVNSETEKANQQIQEQFYGENKENNLLPFHVDSNNPPIKK